MSWHEEDKKLLEKFWVVAVVSNPVRYESRYNLYMRFREHMRESGVNLFTVELQQGDRSFQITKFGEQNVLQLRTWDELWHKECMANLGIARLPSDWQYVAWIDADIAFVNKNWALETVQQLQHYMFVQMFQTAIDLGPTDETMQTHQGFMWGYLNGKAPGPRYLSMGHPGFAWAARREAIDHVGGLLDIGVLGSGDRHMCMSMIAAAQQSFASDVTSEYARHVMRWQERCEKHIRRDVGFVPGTILHSFHGKKKDRGYQDRWKILVKNGFDPELDLMRDHQGLYKLTDRSIKLRDEIRRYFRSRNEDSRDVE
jgi:hypothetical protein